MMRSHCPTSRQKPDTCKLVQNSMGIGAGVFLCVVWTPLHNSTIHFYLSFCRSRCRCSVKTPQNEISLYQNLWQHCQEVRLHRAPKRCCQIRESHCFLKLSGPKEAVLYAETGSQNIQLFFHHNIAHFTWNDMNSWASRHKDHKLNDGFVLCLLSFLYILLHESTAFNNRKPIVTSSGSVKENSLTHHGEFTGECKT